MFDGTSGDEIRGFRGATPLEHPGTALRSSLQERDLRPIPRALITVASPACLLGGFPFGLRLTGPFTCPLPASFPPAGSSLKADWQATSPDHSPFLVGPRIQVGSGGVNNVRNLQPRFGSRSQPIAGVAPDGGWNEGCVPAVPCLQGAGRCRGGTDCPGTEPRNRGCDLKSQPLVPAPIIGGISLDLMCVTPITSSDQMGLRYPNQSEILYL